MVTHVALTGAGQLGLERRDIEACVCELDSTDYYKTLPSYSYPGLMQDVYRAKYLEHRVYMKLQLHEGTVAVISFKKDQSR